MPHSFEPEPPEPQQQASAPPSPVYWNEAQMAAQDQRHHRDAVDDTFNQDLLAAARQYHRWRSLQKMRTEATFAFWGVFALIFLLRPVPRQPEATNITLAIKSLIVFTALLAALKSSPAGRRFSPRNAWFGNDYEVQSVLPPSLLASMNLMQIEDVRAIGPLLDLLAMTDREMRPLIEEVLSTLLPRVSSLEEIALTPAQRATLERALQSRHATLAVAVIELCARSDAWECQPTIRQIAHHTKDPNIRRAAYAYLAKRNEIAAQERVGQTLLRASDPPPAPAGELLRPSQPDKRPSARDLLRPSDPQP